MGYMYEKANLAKDALNVANQLRKTFNQAGLQVTASTINKFAHEPADSTIVPPTHSHETLTMTVSNPDNGKWKEVTVTNSAAYADGYWHTGSVVEVNGQEARSLPQNDSLSIGMQGEKTNETRKIAKKIVAELKS